MRRSLTILALFTLLVTSCNCITASSPKIASAPTYQSDTYANAATEHKHKVTVRLQEFCTNGEFYGSGVIVGPEFVMTAKHMLECGGKDKNGKPKGSLLFVIANRYDGKRVRLEPYWKDASHDIAVLKAKSWVSAMKGDGGKMDLGEYATPDRRRLKKGEVLCYTGGGGTLQVVLTKYGEVYSSTADEIGVGMHVFGGNSGGPLFNSEGKLVGIMWGMRDEDLEGYAVPISVVPEVLPVPASEKDTGAETPLVRRPYK